MVKKRRVYRTVIGIPIWTIIAISIFLIISILYDLGVGDRNLVRYCVLGGAILILLISILMNLVSIKSIRRIAGKQFGS